MVSLSRKPVLILTGLVILLGIICYVVNMETNKSCQTSSIKIIMPANDSISSNSISIGLKVERQKSPLDLQPLEALDYFQME